MKMLQRFLFLYLILALQAPLTVLGEDNPGLTFEDNAAGRRITAYSGTDTILDLPDDVTVIDDNVFRDCKDLVSVLLPAALVTIGDNAFAGCTNLKLVPIPKYLDSIGEGAFADCENITRLNLPNTLTSIGNSAFANCRNLLYLDLPESLETVADNAFEGYSGELFARYGSGIDKWLTEREIPHDYIDEGKLPSGKCGDNLYWEVSGGTMGTNGTLRIYGYGEMYDYAVGPDVSEEENPPWYRYPFCFIDLEEGITKIGSYAFYNKRAFRVTIPYTCDYIGSYAFGEWNGAGIIQVLNGNTNIDPSDTNVQKLDILPLSEENAQAVENARKMAEEQVAERAEAEAADAKAAELAAAAIKAKGKDDISLASAPDINSQTDMETGTEVSPSDDALSPGTEAEDKIKPLQSEEPPQTESPTPPPAEQNPIGNAFNDNEGFAGMGFVPE